MSDGPPPPPSAPPRPRSGILGRLSGMLGGGGGGGDGPVSRSVDLEKKPKKQQRSKFHKWQTVGGGGDERCARQERGSIKGMRSKKKKR